MVSEPAYADSVCFESWRFTVISSRAGVRLIDLHGTPPVVLASRLKAQLAHGGNREVVTQLSEYFSGSRRQFDLPLDLHGTVFQLAVWRKLLKIPYGKTVSYGELALEIGKPKAAHAVGAAVGANPIPIIIPCHRVIGKKGDLVGFGGGIELKRRLLVLEGAIPA